MQPQPLIAVNDVEASSRWYRQLLGCQSGHGGSTYERLEYNGRLVLQLHKFDSDHDMDRSAIQPTVLTEMAFSCGSK